MHLQGSFYHLQISPGSADIGDEVLAVNIETGDCAIYSIDGFIHRQFPSLKKGTMMMALVVIEVDIIVLSGRVRSIGLQDDSYCIG